MAPDTRTPFERFRPWRRWFEVGFWLATMAFVAVANVITVVMDSRRAGPGLPVWEPAIWEFSSVAMWLLLVGPIVWFSRRVPFHWDTWRRHLPVHVLASVVVSLLHVLGMIGLRELGYRWMGADYQFGSWPRGLFYEYLKDVRTYAAIVLAVELYRLVLRRMQGEASVLAVPDHGPPIEPVERPERFLVRKLGREFLVAANDIECLQASGNYVNLRVRGHDYPLRSTMAGIEDRLDPARFLRVHRSYIVNLDHIASIEPLDTGDARVHLKDGQVVPASRTYRSGLRGRLGLDS